MSEPEPARPILVLHAPSDEAFARGYLAPALGLSAAGGAALSSPELERLSLPEREQVIRGKRVLVVVTPALFADPVLRDLELAASSAEVSGDARVIPILLEEAPLPLRFSADSKPDFRRRKYWDRELRALRHRLAQPEPVAPRPACPYPGMQPFRHDQAAHFHGREAEIAEVLARLDAGEREVYVIGPSGCGKSSLITAGVLPRLDRTSPESTIIHRTLRPGSAPAQRLAEALGVKEHLPAGIAALLAGRPDARLIVFVDQLEELFTQGTPEERARFAAALRAVREEPRCTLLLALRADFYGELLESELWRDGPKRHVDLLPLRGAALREAIEQPARALGVYFERGLVERLLADAAEEPGVLPLLQETLVQLWDRMRERLLALADYEALGEGGRSGLAVAISSRADRCLREMTRAQESLARRTLLRLVSFGEGRPNTRRRQPRAALGAGEPSGELEAVLARLQEARLITLDGDERTGEVRVDLCHEALIAAWPPFLAWVEARRADEQRRRQLQASAEEWVARGRGGSGLLDAGELAAAEAWRRTDAARELGEAPEVTALIDASRRALGAARRRRRWLIGGVVGGLAAFAAVATTLAVIASQQADAARAQRRAAERLLGEQDRELGRQLVVDGRDEQAIPHLVAARERGADDPVLRMLFRTATRAAPIASVRHGGAVTSASWSRDGARIATSSQDRTARVWDARTGAPLTPPLEHAESVASAVLGPDGARLLTVSRDDTAWIWDLTALPPSAIPLRPGGPIQLAAFSADGTRVVTAGDKTARVWSASTGQVVSSLPLYPYGTLRDAELSPDGARVVTASGGAAELWDATTGRRIAELPTTAHVARFSPEGDRIITASGDQKTTLWDGATGEQVNEVEHDATVIDVAFGPGPMQLAAARSDGNVWVYGRHRLQSFAHPPSVRRVMFSADGARVLSQGHDRSVRVWDLAGSTPLATLKPGAGTNDAALGPDGAHVVTPGADGVARIWHVAQGPRELGDPVDDATFSPDGAQLAVLAEGELQLWSRAGQVLRRAPVHRLPERSLRWTRILFSPDGGRLALITPDYEVQLWNLGTGETRIVLRGPDHHNENLPLSRPPPCFAFSPDGRRFAAALTRHAARIWDSDTGAPVTPPMVHAGQLASIRFSPDGGRVITSAAGGVVRAWDAASGQPAGPALDHPRGIEVLGAEPAPDGARVATIGGDQIVRLWDAATGRLTAQLEHGSPVGTAVFSPDGARILTSSNDRSLRIWDAASGALAAPPIAPGFPATGSFSPDGGRIATLGEDQVQIWDAATGRALTAPFLHPATVRAARFSPDGSSLLTLARGQIRIWDVGLDERTLAEWQQLAERGSLRRRAP